MQLYLNVGRVRLQQAYIGSLSRRLPSGWAEAVTDTKEAARLLLARADADAEEAKARARFLARR